METYIRDFAQYVEYFKNLIKNKTYALKGSPPTNPTQKNRPFRNGPKGALSIDFTEAEIK